MLRRVAAWAGIALLACGAWWFLRRTGVHAPAARPAQQEALETAPDTRTATHTPASELARAAVAEEAVERDETAEEKSAPATGVLAGRLLLDGQSLRESAKLALWPAPGAGASSESAFTTDALGRFRFEGISEDWSGRLVLFDPYRVAGADEERSTFVDVDALSESLVIDVERLPCLIGRLTHTRPELGAAVDVDLSLHAPS